MGVSVYALLAVVTGLVAARRNAFAGSRTLSAASVIVLATAGLSGAASWHAERDSTLHNKTETALIESLTRMNSSPDPVYIVNAPATFSAPHFFRRAYGLRFDVVFLNQFGGCGDVRLATLSTAQTIHVDLPPCANFLLPGVSARVMGQLLAGPTERTGIGWYHFPFASIRQSRGRTLGVVKTESDLGHHLDIRLLKALPRVLAYDSSEDTYVELTPPGGQS